MNVIKKFIFVILIINILGCGISLILQSSLGSDAITLLNEGIHIKLGISYTIAGLIYNGTLLLIALLLNKKFGIRKLCLCTSSRNIYRFVYILIIRF